MGELLYVSLLTSLPPDDVEDELAECRNAALLYQEEIQEYPEHLPLMTDLMDDDEIGYSIHVVIDADEPVEGSGLLAWILECRRQDAINSI